MRWGRLIWMIRVRISATSTEKRPRRAVGTKANLIQKKSSGTNSGSRKEVGILILIWKASRMILLRWVRTPSNHRQSCHCHSHSHSHCRCHSHCHRNCQTDNLLQHPNNFLFDSTTSDRVHLPRTGSSRTWPCSIENTTKNHRRLTCIGLANLPALTSTVNRNHTHSSIKPTNQTDPSLYPSCPANSPLRQTRQTGTLLQPQPQPQPQLRLRPRLQLLPQLLPHHSHGSAGTSFPRTRSVTIILLPPKATRNSLQYQHNQHNQHSQHTVIQTWPSHPFLPPDLDFRFTNDEIAPRPTTSKTIPTTTIPSTLAASSPQRQTNRANRALVGAPSRPSTAQTTRGNSYNYPSTALGRTDRSQLPQLRRHTQALDGILYPAVAKIASDTRLLLESPRPQMCR